MDIFGDIHVYGDNSKIHLNCKPTAEHPFNGFTTFGLTKNKIKFGDILYFNAINNIWELADAGSSDSIPARGVALSDFDAKGIKILLHGFVYLTQYTNIKSTQLWLSNTPGRLTATQPKDMGNYVQTIGYSAQNNVFYFDFCPFYIQLG